MDADDQNRNINLNFNFNVEISEQIKLVISKLIDSESIKKFSTNMSRYQTVIKAKLHDNNWFFTPSMTPHLWSDICNNVDESDLESFFDAAFISYFSVDNFDNLDYMVKDWQHSQLLSDRIHILKECVSVLKDSTGETSNIKNPNYLIIPTLIAQIDGSMTSYLLKNGYDYKGQKLKNVNNGKVNNKETLFKEEVTDFLKAEYAKESFMSAFLLEECNAAIHLLLDILFQQAFPEEKMDDLKFPFSRHKIMHGQFLEYGNLEDTIRLFLILDFISDL